MPASIVSTIAMETSRPPSASRPKMTPQSPTIEPIERSISPADDDERHRDREDRQERDLRRDVGEVPHAQEALVEREEDDGRGKHGHDHPAFPEASDLAPGRPGARGCLGRLGVGPLQPIPLLFARQPRLRPPTASSPADRVGAEVSRRAPRSVGVPRGQPVCPSQRPAWCVLTALFQLGGAHGALPSLVRAHGRSARFLPAGAYSL